MSSTIQPLICKPIGLIHTSKRVKFDTPHQPTDGVGERNVVELFPGQRFEEGLRDLEGFERVWIVWWFDRNPNWRPLVTPPRGTGKRRGIFATRSPHRPCPIGMTAVPLIEICGRRIIVGNVDLLDQTPILDIKPYISEVDSFPDQSQGWLDQEAEAIEILPQYKVVIAEAAQEQISYLSESWGVSFIEKTLYILERSPYKSRANRITSPKDGVFRLSSGAWRVFFSVTDAEVLILRVAPGYPRSLLVKPGFEIIPDWQAQLAFLDRCQNVLP